MNVLIAPEPDDVEPMTLSGSNGGVVFTAPGRASRPLPIALKLPLPLPPPLPALRTAAVSAMEKNVVSIFLIFFHCY